jgi:hypothetical protein
MSKFIFIFVMFAIFTSGCQGIKESLSNKRKANTDEFLVKKKNPLIMPPEFYELPRPADANEIVKKEEDKDIDLSKVLKTNKNKTKIITNKSLEKSILKELNKN